MNHAAAIDQIADRIYSAVDPVYRARLRGSMARLHGIKKAPTEFGHIMGPCGWKVYPALHRGGEEVGTVQDTLNDAINSVSRLLAVDPEPKFDGIDKVDAEVRRLFWRQRYNDRRRGGSWHSANMQTNLSAYLHGLGVSRVTMVTDTAHKDDEARGLIKGKKTQRVAVLNQPLLQVVYDQNAVDPYQSDFVAYLDMVPLHEIVRRYPEHAAVLEANAKDWSKSLEARGRRHCHKVVPVVEYWSCGAVDEMPTYAVLVGEGTKVTALDYQENPLGEELNACWRLGVLMPEVGYPMGRAQLAESHEELLQLVLDDLKTVAERGGAVRVLHHGAFSPETIEQMRAGSVDGLTVIEAEKGVTGVPVDKLVSDLPPLRHSGVLDPLMQIAQRRQQAATNTNESARGQFMGRNTPATAYALVQQNQLANNGLETYHTLKWLSSQVTMVSEFARQWDTSPVRLNVFGTQVLFNDPEAPQSMAEVWFEDEANVLVNAASLTGQDDVARRAAAIGEMAQLAQLVQAGQIDMDWYTNELLSTMGIYDTAARAKNTAQPNAAAPADPAMTMMGAEAAPA